MQIHELRDIIIAAGALALAFAIADTGIARLTDANMFITAFIVSVIAVSLGFILHELGHRFFAKRYGFYAEFRMWPQGLALAIVFSFAGFVFAAPGAVYIHQRSDLWGNATPVTARKNGIISVAGPLINIALAATFFTASFFTTGIANTIMRTGTQINIWLGIFNMIPFPPLDGSKVFFWNRKLWALLFIGMILAFIGLFFV